MECEQTICETKGGETLKKGVLKVWIGGNTYVVEGEERERESNGNTPE